MANQYYQRHNEYIPRTRAVGEQVREDYDGVERGFDKLPDPNGANTGFTASFVVENPTQLQSPLPYHQWKYWTEDCNAGGYRLVNLGVASEEGDAASLGVVKDLAYQWKQDVDASVHLLRNLQDPQEARDAVNRQYLKNYVDTHIHPQIPDGGISWSAPRAKGGETVLDPPYNFDLAEVYINGVMQDQTRGAFSIRKSRIQLTQGLETDDEVQVIVGRLTPPGNQEWSLISSDTDAVAGQKFLLDSSLEGNFTVTLPEQPMDGDEVYFLDVGKNLENNPVSINRNGRLIMGEPNNLELGTNHISMKLMFAGVFYGWRILE
ncbi:MAG: hypothetical protein LPD71_00140 [Shewanella sp.]|nr:hypothetical protein [Shewanella sp.]MCF1459475.1 hypothetical protein [Shewanella sp.]